jgi:hypothetical protein
VMFSRCCAGGAGGDGGDAFGCSGVAMASVGVGASVVVPLPVRPGPGRLGLLGMETLEDRVVGVDYSLYGF